uniref:Coactivator CBP, KIX domain-containing protein n=1 Tax=Medicago truncatula TaxID=3880 RepID=I3SDP2_MEDTR|nr:unknown [Medicago truncatula]
MPRPGPRPYECVRRAWHSERHQPLRGSIIQQIFRVVTEAHTPATKKNKEWQEKLPVVVLKAEEIMYSKTNSEAEYLNSDTLWDRLNDAVNTIIRRDETTETGDLLPPCVEAALNLGCKPVRTSRSDRHNNPRTYLGPRPQQPPSGSPKPVVGNPLNYAKVTTPALSPNHVSDSNQHVHQNSKPSGSGNYPYNFPPSQQQPLTMEAKPTMNMGSVYPLYYSGETREPQAQVRTTVRDNTSSDMIFVGRPVITPVPEPSGIGLLENSRYGRFQHVANRIVQETALGTQESPGGECDLSLRLGQCLHPCSSGKSSSASEIDGVGLGLSQEGNKYSHMPLQRNRELFLYPRGAGHGTIDSSSRGNVEGEDQNLEAMFRKRKAPLANNEEDGQFCRHLGVPSNRFTGRPGS